MTKNFLATIIRVLTRLSRRNEPPTISFFIMLCSLRWDKSDRMFEARMERSMSMQDWNMDTQQQSALESFPPMGYETCSADNWNVVLNWNVTSYYQLTSTPFHIGLSIDNRRGLVNWEAETKIKFYQLTGNMFISIDNAKFTSQLTNTLFHAVLSIDNPRLFFYWKICKICQLTWLVDLSIDKTGLSIGKTQFLDRLINWQQTRTCQLISKDANWFFSIDRKHVHINW